MNIVPFIYQAVSAYRSRLPMLYDSTYTMRPMQLATQHAATLRQIAKLQSDLLKDSASGGTTPKLTNQDSIAEITRLAEGLPFTKGNRAQQYNLLDLPTSLASTVGKNVQKLLTELNEAPITDIISTDSWIHEGFDKPEDIEPNHQYLTITGQVSMSKEAAELVLELVKTDPALLLQILLMGFPPFGLPLPPGHFQLGRASVIEISNIQVFERNGRWHLVFLARTSGEHAFDGQVMWQLVFDPAAAGAQLFQSGIGTHNVPLVDATNFFVAPPVFSAAVETLVVRLEQLVKLRKEFPNLSVAQLLSTREELSQAAIRTVIKDRDPALSGMLSTMNRLDQLAYLPAWLRKYGAGANTKAPSATLKSE